MDNCGDNLCEYWGQSVGNLSAGQSLGLSIWIWCIVILQTCSALVAIDELLGSSDRARRRWSLVNLGLQLIIIGTGIAIWWGLP